MDAAQAVSENIMGIPLQLDRQCKMNCSAGLGRNITEEEGGTLEKKNKSDNSSQKTAKFMSKIIVFCEMKEGADVVEMRGAFF